MNKPADKGNTAGRKGLVIVASTRAAAGEYEDHSGKIAVDWLRQRGISTPDALIVADAQMPQVIGDLFAGSLPGAGRPDVLLTSGGTGVSPSDQTVEAMEPHLRRQLPGVAQEFFRVGAEKTPTAVLSRCVAGVGQIGGKPVFAMTLPGSRGGVHDGLEVLDGFLEHLLDQLVGGGDHEPFQDAPGQVAPAVAAAPAADSVASAVSSCCGHDGEDAPEDPPHVAEQTGVVVHTRITEEPLEPLLSSAREATATPAMGAVSTFEGLVRDHDGGELVDSLTYSSHPTAVHVMQKVVEEVVARHPEVRAWVAHRTGPLEIGDLAFLVITAAAHRGPAFAATEELANEVKARVPIWKEQTLADGSTDWVGLDD